MRRLFLEDRILSVETIEAEQVTAKATDTATSEAMLRVVLDTLEGDKAEDVVQIPLRGKSSMADHMIIASGRSARQVGAIAEHLFENVKSEFGISPKTEGKDAGDWVLVDTGDVIIHLFRPEVREFYQLEKMWLSPDEASTAH